MRYDSCAMVRVACTRHRRVLDPAFQGQLVEDGRNLDDLHGEQNRMIVTLLLLTVCMCILIHTHTHVVQMGKPTSNHAGALADKLRTSSSL